MSAQKGAADFGRKLREARERRSLSLRQISNSTKISDADARGPRARTMSSACLAASSAGASSAPTRLKSVWTWNRRSKSSWASSRTTSVTAGHPTTTQLEDHEKVESRPSHGNGVPAARPHQRAGRGVRHLLRHARPAATASADVPRQEAPASATPPERPSESAQPAAASPAAANAVAPVP